MPSSFPGMDPWLEAADLFPGLHDSLIQRIKEALNAVMPPGYVATLKHVVWVDPELRGEFDYHVSVLLAGKTPTYHAAGIRLADRLPVIGIPLDAGVAPVTVDLQPMLDTAYDHSRYSELFSYRDPPDPPLTAEQQAWASGILKEKGLIP